MKIPKLINRFRRYLMRSLTKNIGKSPLATGEKKNIEIKKILISRPNHRLGNLLLLTPLVQEVINTFPGCEIDLFVRGTAAGTIFRNTENIYRIIALPKKPFSNLFQYMKGWYSIRRTNYDLVINASQNSSSGRLSTLFSHATYKFFGEFNPDYQLKYQDYAHFAKYPIYNFRYFLAQLGFDENNDPVPSLDLKLDPEEMQSGRDALHRIVKNNRKTICLFTNATGEKCYSETWWANFHDKIRAEFPQYNIIEILPVDKVSRLDYNIPAFYSTNIRTMGSLIANSSLFISADCGVMHLASAVGTPTIGLFSVTQEKIYTPYNKNSLAINTKKVSSAERLSLIRNVLVNISFSANMIY